MPESISRRALGILAAAFATQSTRVLALEPLQGRPLLTISGRIGVTDDGNLMRLDRASLEAFGTSSLKTKTPWYDGEQHFEGVAMRTLMQALAATGDRITAIALNDYKTEIPMSDTQEFDVLLALKREGAYMPVRDKGPLFIVYPFDSEKRLQSQTYYGRSAWQVSQLIVH
jgi:hypothetical protein